MVTKNNSSDENKNREPGSMYEISRRILLAAIGAVAYAQEEVEQFVSRMVERGEIAEKEGKQLVKEMLEKRSEKRQIIGSNVNKQLLETMERLNVPTKKDIEGLSANIAALTKKIEEMRKSKE